MADIVGYFPATAAVDGASGARLRYAEAQVYAWADTNYTTPLAITDLQGVPMAENKIIAVDGVYPDFRPPVGVLQVRAKSGSYVTPMTSLTVFAQAAQDAATRAEKAALDASQDLDEVEFARQAAVKAAADAAAVGGTTDAQMTAIQGNPASAFAGAQKAMIGAEVPPAVAFSLAADGSIRSNLMDRIAALTAADLRFVQAPRMSPKLAEAMTGFVAWFADTNDRIVLGIKSDGSVSIPKIASETAAALVSSLPVPTLVSTLYGYAGYFADPQGRIPLAFELDGGVVIPKFAASTIDKIKAAVSASGPIICPGDSMTAGSGGTPYTEGLSADLGGRTVVPFGYGGQGARSITARSGAHPVMLSVADNRIPASGSVAVTARDGNLDPGTYVGSLVGVRGSMVVTSGNAMTFTRASDGAATPCPPGTPFFTRPDFRGQQVISWMGRNGLAAADYLTTNIAEDRLALAWAGSNANRSLILSVVPFTTDSADMLARIAALNDAKRQAFPAQFVDVAARMRSADALAEEGITPTAQDLQDISNGFTPLSFRSDEGHFNTAGYRRVRRIVVAELNAREA